MQSTDYFLEENRKSDIQPKIERAIKELLKREGPLGKWEISAKLDFACQDTFETLEKMVRQDAEEGVVEFTKYAWVPSEETKREIEVARAS